MKPLLFLDVDGVLNCFSDKNGEWFDVPFISPFDLSKEPTIDMKVCIPLGTQERIAKLLDHFEIVWCTAWFGAAHGAFKKALGLPDESWPYVNWNQYKLPELIKFAHGRSWAFVDDDIQFELNGLGWDVDRHIPDNGLLVDVNPNYGLSDEHVTALVKFAQENT